MNIETSSDPVSLLRRKLETGPGISVPAAIERAEARIGQMRGGLEAAVDAEIEFAVTEASYATPERIRPLYDCADRIVAMAAACGLPGVSAVAMGLCDLLDWMEFEKRWDPLAIAAYVVSLPLLRSDPSDALADSVIDSLTTLRGRFVPTAVAT